MAPERLLSNIPGAIQELGYAFQERARIAEYCGGLPREKAEPLAWQELRGEWQGRGLRFGRAKASGVTSHWLPPPWSCYGEAP